VDPAKEPPLVTANVILSILGVDYPVDKVSCYLSDDGASMLTFDALSETSEFARKWVPFCKKFSIEPRAPEMYFCQKIDYLKDKVQPTFVKERRAMKVSLMSPNKENMFFLKSTVQFLHFRVQGSYIICAVNLQCVEVACNHHTKKVTKIKVRCIDVSKLCKMWDRENMRSLRCV
jgi:hypothetical protein